jgi:diaminopimelate decarboxylase
MTVDRTRTDEVAAPNPRNGMEDWSACLDFRALADEFGTPTYLFNVERLRANVASYLRLVGVPAGIVYPVKANPSFAVLRRLADIGCGMDCASRDEIDASLIAGVPYDRLSYNTPAPDFGLVRNLLRAGAAVVVDSEDLLIRMNAKILAAACRGAILLRVNIDAGLAYSQHFQWEDMVSHGTKTGKFGIPAERIVELLAGVSLPVVGLHVHVGTMMDNLAAFENMLELLHRLVDEIHLRTAHRVTRLNLGGGLGIQFVPGQSFPDINSLADRLKPRQRDGIRYFVEPGQSLVGDAIGLVTRVVSLKRMRGKRWAIIDVGSDQLIKITTVSWYHQILDQRHKPLPFEGPDSVGGPLCFAGDTILPSTNLEGVQEGDVLFLQHAGAYLEAVANRFNGRRSVGTAVLEQGKIHRATTSEDPFFCPPLQTYDWTESEPNAVPGALNDFGVEEINALRSRYFGDHAKNDHYEITRFCRMNDRSFTFEFEPRCSVDFISVPFAMRITADAVIIAVLAAMGKQFKDVDVWGSKGTFSYREPIRPGKRVAGTISLSPLAEAFNAKHRVIVTATLDGARFSMTSEVVV